MYIRKLILFIIPLIIYGTTKNIKYLLDDYNCWHKFNQRKDIEKNSNNTQQDYYLNIINIPFNITYMQQKILNKEKKPNVSEINIYI